MRVAQINPFAIVRLTAAISVVLAMLVVVHAGQRPRASPHESVGASIDGSEISITYGRPYMRGRAIFGALVAYGRVWCPGADEATTLDSTRALQVGDLMVPAGPHTIWLLPTSEDWTLIVSKDPSGFHTNYNAAADLGRIRILKRAIDTPVDQLTFAIEKNAAGAGGSIKMTWETTEVSAPFTIK